MLKLRADAQALPVVEALRDAARFAGNVLGGNDNASGRVLDAYRNWINNAIVQVGQWLDDSELDRVLTTRRYWSLHTLDAADFSPGTLAEFVRTELKQRTVFFEREAAALEAEAERWALQSRGGPVQFNAVVLDTNVLLTHHSYLGSVNWNQILGLGPGDPLALAIPLQVIRELDRLKMANNNNINRGTKDELRKDAGAALRLIEDQIVDPSVRATVRRFEFRDNQSKSDLALLLIADDDKAPPLADPDSEIIARASSTRPFVKQAFFVSYDAGAVFKARQAGLKAFKLSYRWDKS